MSAPITTPGSQQRPIPPLPNHHPAVRHAYVLVMASAAHASLSTLWYHLNVRPWVPEESMSSWVMRWIFGFLVLVVGNVAALWFVISGTARLKRMQKRIYFGLDAGTDRRADYDKADVEVADVEADGNGDGIAPEVRRRLPEPVRVGVWAMVGFMTAFWIVRYGLGERWIGEEGRSWYNMLFWASLGIVPGCFCSLIPWMMLCRLKKWCINFRLKQSLEAEKAEMHEV